MENEEFIIVEEKFDEFETESCDLLVKLLLIWDTHNCYINIIVFYSDRNYLKNYPEATPANFILQSINGFFKYII